MSMRADPAAESPDRTSRMLAAALAVALLVAAVILTLSSLDVANAPLCSDPQALAREAADQGAVECYEESAARRVITVGCGIGGALLALIASGAGLWIAAAGRSGRYLMPLTAAALALGGLSILIDNL